MSDWVDYANIHLHKVSALSLGFEVEQWSLWRSRL